MSDKIQNSIYLLKDEIRIRNKRTKQVLVKEINFDFLAKHLKEKKFVAQIVKSDLSNLYEIKVYYKKSKNNIKWKEFIETIVEEGQDILMSNRSKSESYIVLIRNIKTNNIYASTGGYAHITIQELATTDFGIEILSRLVKGDEKMLRSTKERNLTGGIQGEIKFFRNEYNLYENENFGKIYNELNASLNKNVLEKTFGFPEKNLKDSLCIVKNSFSLKKSISFQELLKIIEKCESLLLQPPVVEINNVEKITKSESILMDNLMEDLLEKVYKNYNNVDDFYSIEISNKDFEKYFSASYSILTLKSGKTDIEIQLDENIREIQTILDLIKSEIGFNLSYDEFKKVVVNSQIETFDENSTLTKDTLINHFCTEINYDKNVYFLIEKDWYRVKNTFIEGLNNQALSFFNDSKFVGPKLNKWNKGNENEFNESHLLQRNTFVFDKVTPSFIEVCDLMKIDDDSVYFYHVKKGFDNSMRDLCNQVFISARKIQEDSKMNFNFLQSLYDRVMDNEGEEDYFKNIKKQFAKLEKEDFVKLIENKKIVFVLSVLDTAKSKRILYTDIKKFNSNIAKFTLLELSKSMRTLGVDFKVFQLQK